MSEQIKITDHAIVRYLERVHEIDIEAMKKQMADHINKKIKNIPKGHFVLKTGAGVKFVFQDGILVTVKDKTMD